jgi:flavin reductase (DIM6/NTAB) family NADH-FMN oxidoreductase RutF
MSQATVDESRAFRNALGIFPTGVTVITTRDTETGRAVGLTVSSFNSVSLQPRLVLWSIARTSPNLDQFAVGKRHVIHVLAQDQGELARRFANPKLDKFEGVALAHNPQDAPPVLQGVAAHFECETESLLEGGDHWIVLSRVHEYQTHDQRPLLFWSGQLTAVGTA